MCSLTCRIKSRVSQPAGSILLSWLILGLATIMATGCEDDVQPVGGRPSSRALDQTGVTVDQGESSRATAVTRPSTKQPRPILGQRTSDIRNAATEVKTSDIKVVKPKITAKDYISLQGNAYVSIIGQTSVLKIQHAMDLYRAQNDRYPKDYDEFMTEIIKANGIALPQLPPYQKYGYDDKGYKLVILESQALKDLPPPR
jgi:hypothetical protein